MIQGSMVALVTPMTSDGQLDWDSLHNLVAWHLEKGSHGLVAVGTTGESSTLSVDEHLEVVRRVVKQVKGRIPVIAGTGANATDEAVTLTAAAKECGADACLLVTPYYNKPTQEGLFRHFEHIAKSVAIPQILYNVPGRTGVDMTAQTVIRLAAIPNIVGIKEATGDMARAGDIVEACGDDFAVISGDDFTAVELMLLGGKGSITVTGNVAPAQLARICDLAVAGEAKLARTLDKELLPVHQAMFLESNPIPVKWAVAEMGLIAPGIRLPMTPLSEQFHSQVRSALREAGLL
ncbi:MAG: 4-hydroxy-tetrahydrodipicolinate synthase [Exilibacterium sp.]